MIIQFILALALQQPIVTIGHYKYIVVNDCSKGLGEIKFPYNDVFSNREFVVCGKYSGLQEKEIIWHELVHACLHDHPHFYANLSELNKELYDNKYSDEEVANKVGICLANLPLNIEGEIDESLHEYGKYDK